MYVKPWHPELAMVEMRVLRLSQDVSASSCERNRSAHGHIHSKLRNRLEHATTEKLIYVYSNSKMVMLTNSRCLHGLCITWKCKAAISAMRQQVILRHTVLLAGHSPGEPRVAKSLSRLVAHFSRVAESRVAALQLGATRPTLDQENLKTLAPGSRRRNRLGSGRGAG